MSTKDLLALKDQCLDLTLQEWYRAMDRRSGVKETLAQIQVFNAIHELVCRELAERRQQSATIMAAQASHVWGPSK